MYQWLPQEYYPIMSKAGIFFAAMMGALYAFIVCKSDVEIDNDLIVKLAFLSVLMVPFFLPKMHERFFFSADVISILYAFYFPRYFYVPILVSSASFFSYFPYLFGKTIFPLSHLAIILLFVIILVAIDVIRSLHPRFVEVALGHGTPSL